jgi:hypothetical protein
MECVVYLVSKGADPSLKNKSRKSSREIAQDLNLTDIVEYLSHHRKFFFFLFHLLAHEQMAK